jgi:cytidine deaminase
MISNKELRELAKNASEKAYSPYSHACVGSAILTSNNKTYTGCNIENSSYGGTVCAERVAIFKAISEEKVTLKKVYVYTKPGWPPCGLCRQVISEFAAPELEIIIGDELGKETIMKFSDLMPLSFTPDHLLK